MVRSIDLKVKFPRGTNLLRMTSFVRAYSRSQKLDQPFPKDAEARKHLTWIEKEILEKVKSEYKVFDILWIKLSIINNCTFSGFVYFGAPDSCTMVDMSSTQV